MKTKLLNKIALAAVVMASMQTYTLAQTAAQVDKERANKDAAHALRRAQRQAMIQQEGADSATAVASLNAVISKVNIERKHLVRASESVTDAIDNNYQRAVDILKRYTELRGKLEEAKKEELDRVVEEHRSGAIETRTLVSRLNELLIGVS